MRRRTKWRNDEDMKYFEVKRAAGDDSPETIEWKISAKEEPRKNCRNLKSLHVCRLNLETCPGLDVLLLVLDWILIRTRVSEPNLCVRRKTLHCFPPDWAEIHLRKEQLWKEEFVLVLWPLLDLMKMIHSLNLKGKSSVLRQNLSSGKDAFV